MTGADLGGGVALVQAARAALTGSQGGWRRRPDWWWLMPESELARPPQRLLFCALAESVESEGMESDRGLEGDGCAAVNIESAAA
jgi:hypothetical protein